MGVADHPEPDSQLECLIVRAANGHARSFEELVNVHERELREFIDRRLDHPLRKRVGASDVVQQTFVEAHRRIKEFAARRPMPFKVWLMKTAIEQLRDERVKHLKRERRTANREVELPTHSSLVLAHQLAGGSAPSQLAMKRERQRALAGLIERMSSADRDVLLLRHVDNLRFEDIGKVLEINAATARKRHARAIVRLRQLCIDNGIGSDIR